MKRNFKISEDQYRKALSEGITLNADVDACNGDVKQAIDKTKQNAKNNGVTKTEMASIITHCAFYMGWPKAWA